MNLSGKQWALNIEYTSCSEEKEHEIGALKRGFKLQRGIIVLECR